MKGFIVILLCLVSFGVFAQTNEELSASSKLNGEAESAMNSKDFDTAFGKAKEAYDIVKGTGHQEELRGAVNVANAASGKKDHRTAADYFVKGADIADELGNDDIKIYCLVSAGKKYNDLGKYDKAISSLKDLTKSSGLSSKDKAFAYDALAFSYYSSNKTKEAIKWYEKAADASAAVGDTKKQASQLFNAGQLYANYGNHDMALSSFNEAMKIADAGLKSQIEKAIENVEKNKSNESNNISDFTQELNEEKDDYISHMEFENAKSLEEIESLSLENQVMELKVLAQKEQFEKQALKDSLEKEALNREKAIEIATRDADLAKANAEKKAANAWLMGIGGVAALLLALVFIVIKNNKRLKDKNETIATQNVQLDKKNTEIMDSINYASRIQQALMASNATLADAFSQHFIINNPRDIVSGDFSWCDYNGKDTVLVVADCTGHGVPGALMSVLSISNMEKVVKQLSTRRPKDILAKINNEFYHLFGRHQQVKDGMDVVVVRVNHESNKVEFAGSRNSILIHHNNELVEHKGSKKHLGLVEHHTEFNELNMELSKGDAIYLYSDGYPDQKGGKEGKKFYPKRFRELINDNANKDMAAQKQVLEDTFTSWRGNNEQIDDVLVVGVRI